MRALLADLVLLVHAAYIVFVVGGFVVIVAGIIRRWTWIRNPWFRCLHLAAMGLVVLETWCGVACPLTVWEDALRAPAGGSPATSFVARWLQRLIFFDAPGCVFIVAYSLFTLLLIATLLAAPPRWRR